MLIHTPHSECPFVIKLSDIKEGTVFQIADDQFFYMKTDVTKHEVLLNIVSAVDLSTGQRTSFVENRLCRPLTAAILFPFGA